MVVNLVRERVSQESDKENSLSTTHLLNRIARLCALIVLLIGASSSLTYIFNLPLVTRWSFDFNSLGLSVALGFTLLGFSTWLICRPQRHLLDFIITLAAVLVPFLLGLSSFGQFYSWGTVSLGPFSLAKIFAAGSVSDFTIESPLVAVFFVFSSLATGLWLSQSWRRISQLLAALVLFFSLSLGLARLLGVSYFLSFAFGVPIIFSFIFWSLAVLLSPVEEVGEGEGQPAPASQFSDSEGKSSEAAIKENLSESFKVYSLGPVKESVEVAQKTAEIKETRDRLKEIFDSSPNLVFIKNKQGFYEFVNRKYESVYRISGEELRGKTGAGYFPRELLDHWRADDSLVVDRGQLVNVEERVVEADGVLHTYIVTRFPLLDSGGGVRAVCGIGTDITDLRDYQSLLIKEKAQSEAILDSVGEGLIATDNNGNLILMNRASQEMLGFKQEDLAGQPWTQKIRLEDEEGQAIEEKKRPILQAIKNKKNFFVSDFYYVRNDGSRFPVALTTTPILFQGGVMGAIATFRDIRREKELDRAKDEFVFMVSHELKAPLAAVKAGISVVLAGRYGSLSQDLKGVIVKMAEYVERLLGLVEDILSVSKIESGALKLKLERLKLKPIVNEVFSSLKILSEGKGLELEVGGIDESEVLADAFLVNEILTNLVSNAIKFTDRGKVTIGAQVKNNFLEISVVDTGRGIPPVDQVKLFKKFQQISSAKSGRPAGTGLGLYISKKMAQLLGGDLRLASSAVGQGSLFVLSLPLAPKPEKNRQQKEKN